MKLRYQVVKEFFVFHQSKVRSKLINHPGPESNSVPYKTTVRATPPWKGGESYEIR